MLDRQYLNEASWNWRLMKTIMTVCHVYDKEQNYVAFDELAPEDLDPDFLMEGRLADSLNARGRFMACSNSVTELVAFSFCRAAMQCIVTYVNTI